MFLGHSHNSFIFRKLSKMKRMKSDLITLYLTLLGLCSATQQTEEHVVLEKSHDIKAWQEGGWDKLERAPPSEGVFLTFALKQTNLESLERVFWEVSDPGSKEYGKHLSLSKLTQLIAPSETTISNVQAWLRSHNVQSSDCQTIFTKDFITCRMSCESAEAMLVGAKFYRFKHAKLTKSVVRSLQHYSVPRRIVPHIDFVGGVLHFPAVKGPSLPKVRRREFSENMLKRDLIYTGVYPDILRERYKVFDVVGTHPDNRQSIASFLEQYYSPADLKAFFDIFGSSFRHLKDVTKVIGPNNGTPGSEASLDIQYIMSLGAMVPTWIWSTPESSQDPFLRWLLDISNHSEVPWVHSVSYSGYEDEYDVSYMNRVNVEFQKAGVRGLTFLFASGDDGADCKNSKFRPEYPSSSPYVTTVGGTELNDLFTPEYGHEISGGGFSNVFPRPSYQNYAVEKYLKSGSQIPPPWYFNLNGRGYPDISAACDYFWIVDNLDLEAVYGTSASTPTVAGIISLLNDARLQNNKSTLGFLNPFLYQNSAAMYDVTTGHNEGCLPGDIGFYASTGWDPVTGCGTPNFLAMVNAALKYH